jgi:hypothetical protein
MTLLPGFQRTERDSMIKLIAVKYSGMNPNLRFRLNLAHELYPAYVGAIPAKKT